MSPTLRPNHRRFAILEFLRTEQSAGMVLFLAAIAALVWANASASYEGAWTTELRLGGIAADLRHWVNDGLMTLFFFVVGLEIKRELVIGELRDARTAMLPAVAAIGGMAGPALLYLVLNAGKEGQGGWGIPMATDIAFVVGATALLGSRAPQRLRVFLLALAIVDDIGAIVVIALVYSAGGIHPTLIAVALGLLVPAKPVAGRALHETLERRLHPVSSYAVIPLFALANAGVRVDAASVGSALDSPVFWGVVVGLALGKLAGITTASLLAVRAGIGRLPEGVGPRALAGGAALAGIGFTVSLFIVRLAFDDPDLVLDATLGVLVGSAASGVIGSAVLLVRGRGDVNRS